LALQNMQRRQPLLVRPRVLPERIERVAAAASLGHGTPARTHRGRAYARAPPHTNLLEQLLCIEVVDVGGPQARDDLNRLAPVVSDGPLPGGDLTAPLERRARH